MSKIVFTIAFPHDSPDGNRTPQFMISCNNNTYLSVRGKDLKGARWGNSNAKGGFKNRFEFSVSGHNGVTRLSLIVNTSVILPPLFWSLPTGEVSKSQHGEKERERRKHGSKERSMGREKNDRTSTLDDNFKTKRRQPREEDRISGHRIKDSSEPSRSTRTDEKGYGAQPPYHGESGRQGSLPSSRTESSKGHRPVNRKRVTRKVFDPGFNDFPPNPDF